MNMQGMRHEDIYLFIISLISQIFMILLSYSNLILITTDTMVIKIKVLF